MQLTKSTWFFAFALSLSSGCEKQQGDAPKQQAAPAKPAESGPYAAYKFPPISDDWGTQEYTQVRHTLYKIDKDQPELLPTLAGAKGDVLARFASPEALAKAIAKAPDLGSISSFAEDIGEVYTIYGARVFDAQPFAAEYLLLTNTMVHSANAQFARAMSLFGEAKVREDGLLDEMRKSLSTIYFIALATPLKIPATVDARTAVAALGASAAHVAPFLVPDERQRVDQVLTILGGLGADPLQVAAARASIDGTAIHPLFSEARAADLEDTKLLYGVFDQRQPWVKMERGSTRYEFPELDCFSAVFHQQPSAMGAQDAIVTEDSTVKARLLGVRDETGYATSIVCVSRTTEDGPTFARKIIDGTKASDIREIEIDGHNGFEASFSNSSSSGIMQTVALERGGCVIVVESPPQQAEANEEQARAFLKSVKLGNFEG